MFARYFNLLARHPQAFFIVFWLGILLVLPSLAAGFFADDFTHFILINEGSFVKQPNNLSLYHLFSFVDTNPERRTQLYGFSIMPWWSSPQFSLIFFRPLSEITHYIDYHWLKSYLPLMHLHSIFWYGFLLILLTRFYQTFCISNKVALLAFLFFIADATHGFTVAWLANRNAILAASFTLLAILGHHSFREHGKVSALLCSLVGIICSFLAAEAGIVVGVFLFAYALFLDKAGPLKGLFYLLPALLIFLCWLGIYKHYHYGASGNQAYYIDPIESPALFLANLPDRLLRTLAMQFSPIPVHLFKPYKLFMTLLGGLFFIALLFPLKQGATARYRFFLCIMLLAIVPISSAELQDRNMLFVGIAACPLLADFIYYLYRQPQHWIIKTTITVIVVFHLLFSALLMLVTSYSPKLLASSSIATAKSLPSNIADQYILSFGAPIFDACYTAAIRKTNGLVLPQQFWNVTTATSGLTIQKTGSHQFRISNQQGLFSGIDTMLRDVSFDPITVGTTINMNGLLLTVRKLNADGVPSEAELNIDLAISSNNIALYYWERSQLRPMTMTLNSHKSFPP